MNWLASISEQSPVKGLLDVNNDFFLKIKLLYNV